MKKVKVALSTLAVMIAAGMALTTNAAKKLNTVTVPVSLGDDPLCRQVGTCTVQVSTALCKTADGLHTLFSISNIPTRSCNLPASGTYHPPL